MSAEPQLHALRRLLSRGPFARYMVGESISMVGTWMQVAAQSWLVTTLSTKATVLGAIHFAGGLPMLLLTIIGGSFADRFDKRYILYAVLVTQIVLAVLIGRLVATGQIQIWHLLAVTALLGIAAAFEVPTVSAFVPELVAKEDIYRALAIDRSLFHATRLFGPALGGWLIEAFGTPKAYYLNAVSFLALAAAIATVPPRPRGPAAIATVTPPPHDPAAIATVTPPPHDLTAIATVTPPPHDLTAIATVTPPPRGPADEEEQRKGPMSEGFHFVRKDAPTRAMVLLMGAMTVFTSPFLLTTMPLFARVELGLGSRDLGILMGIAGLGSFVGSLGLLSIQPGHRALFLKCAAAATVLGLGCLSLAHSMATAGMSMVLMTLGLSTSFGTANIVIQERAPDAIRGRVSAVAGLAFFGILPFSGLFVSWIVDFIGLRVAMGCGAVGYALTAALLLAGKQQLASAPPASPQAE